MALAQTQALLARLFTDGAARRAYFADPMRFARGAGLSETEAQSLAALDRREVEAFAQTLLGKRALDARKVLPLTARALGKDFDALLFAAIVGPPSPGRHRADAASLARHLAARSEPDPSWIADLARYELAFIEATRPGAALLLRTFQHPVAKIARQIVMGATPLAKPRASFGLWLRAPGGRLWHWMR